MSWSKHNPEKDLSLISVYEDWDDAVRPPQERTDGNGVKREPKDFWRPVYVRLKDRVEGENGTAAKLLKLIDPGSAGEQEAAETFRDATGHPSGDLLGPHVTRRTLRVLRSWRRSPKTDEELEARRHLVVYRKGNSYQHSDLFTVLRVGPAVPGSFLWSILNDGLRGGTLPEPDVSLVATGIIDDAIGFAHERFRLSKSETRIAHFWKQSIEYLALPDIVFIPVDRKPSSVDDVNLGLVDPNDVGVGRALDANKINELLGASQGDERAIYTFLESDSGKLGNGIGANMPGQRQTMTLRASHGTFVADLAAGFPPNGLSDDEFRRRPIFAVELPPIATSETWGARLEFYVLLALLQLIDWADNWVKKGGTTVRIPLVVNLSYGFSAGPKNGSGFLESAIDRHVKARNSVVPTAFVVAAGNDYRGRLRAEFTLPGGSRSRRVDLRLQPQDRTPSFLEIRVPNGFQGKLEVVPPGKSGCTLEFGSKLPECQELKDGARLVARLYVQRTDKTILVTLATSPTQNFENADCLAPAGAWAVTVKNTGAGDAAVTLDVQRDDSPRGFPSLGRQAYLDAPDYGEFDGETRSYTAFKEDRAIYRKGTLSAIATTGGSHIFCVGGAIDARRDGDHHREPARYTSSGPTIGRKAPDLAAVSEDGFATGGIMGAGTFSGSAITWGGSSAAAAVVTRRIVDHLLSHRRLPAPAKLISGAVANPPDARLGKGVVKHADSGRKARRR